MKVQQQISSLRETADSLRVKADELSNMASAMEEGLSGGSDSPFLSNPHLREILDRRKRFRKQKPSGHTGS